MFSKTVYYADPCGRDNEKDEVLLQMEVNILTTVQ